MSTLAKARLVAREPVRFLLVGVANTLTALSVIYALIWAFDAPNLVANVFGYAVGLIISYLLNGRWTFGFRGSLAAALPRFVLVLVVAYLANLLTVCAALYIWSINHYIAHAAGVVPYTLISYFGSKLFVFVDKRAARP